MSDIEYTVDSLGDAAYAGDLDKVKIIAEKVDVNEKDVIGKTALHWAAMLGHREVCQWLLEKGSDIHAKNDLGDTPLMEACEYGRTETAEFLIQKGSHLEMKNNQGKTALLYAAERGSEATTQLLVDRGANVNVTDNSGKTALLYAAERGSEATTQLLVDTGANVNVTDNSGKTALHYAVERGSEAIAQLLVDRGANVNVTDNSGKTALHYAVERGSEAIAQLLVDRGANVNVTDNSGLTALQYAAKSGSEATNQILVDSGANVNVTDKTGLTALHFAAERGSEAATQLLVDRGANVNATDDNGKTALHYAPKSGSEATTQLLVDRGANVNATDDNGWTTLHYAAYSGSEAIYNLLLARGSDVNATDKSGKSALDIALMNGNVKLAEKMIPDKQKLLLYCIKKNYFYAITLLHSKSDDVRYVKNNTLLMCASIMGRSRIVSHLLLYGKDVSAVNDDGDTALHLAAQHGHVSVLKHLLKYGASLQCQNNKGYTPEVSAKLKSTKGCKQVCEYLAKIRNKNDSKGQDDSYYDVPTPLTMPPLTPRTYEHLIGDEDVAELVESDVLDTDDDSSLSSTSSYFNQLDFNVPPPSSSISVDNFAVPIYPASRSGQAGLTTQTQGNSGYISQPNFTVPGGHSPSSTITRISVSADNFAVPTHPAPRSRLASLSTQAQGNSNDDSASKIEQLKLQLAAERRAKEAEKRKNEAIIADKKRKDQAIADKKRKLSDQEQKLAEKDQVISAKEQVITAKDEVINTKEQVITAKDEVINTKEQVIADKKQKLSEKQQIIEDKDLKLSQKEQVIAEKGKKLKKKDQRLKSIGKRVYESDDEAGDKPSDSVSGEKSNEESSVFHNEYHRDIRIQGLFAHKADYKLSKKDFENVPQLMHYVCAVYYHIPAGTYNGTGLFLGLVKPQVQGSTVSINPSSVLPGAANIIPQVVVQSQPVLPSQPGTSTTSVPQTFTQFTGPPIITGPVAVILISGHNLEKWNPNVQPGELIFDWYERTGGNVLKSWSSGVIGLDTTLDYALLFTSDINVISRFNNVIPPRLMVNTNIPPSIPPKETTMTLIGHPRDSHMEGDHVEIIDKQTVLADKDFNCAISAAKFGAKKGANLHVVEEDFSIIYNCTSFHGASGAPCFRLVDGNVELVCIHGGGIFLNTTNPTLQDKSDFEFGNLMSYILSDINGKLPTLGLQWV